MAQQGFLQTPMRRDRSCANALWDFATWSCATWSGVQALKENFKDSERDVEEKRPRSHGHRAGCPELHLRPPGFQVPLVLGYPCPRGLPIKPDPAALQQAIPGCTDSQTMLWWANVTDATWPIRPLRFYV